MPGPGSAAKLRLPRGWPRTDPAIVWSWVDGKWWRVNGGASLEAMVASAAARTAATLRGLPPNYRLGTGRMDPYPGARFVATDQHGDPEMAWWDQHVAEAVCNACGWEGIEAEAPSGKPCPECGQDDVNYFTRG